MKSNVSEEEWQGCQLYERESWGKDVYLTPDNGEVVKQNTYAHYMGLTDSDRFDAIDAKEKSILDVGCGPVSLLLRTKNAKRKVGVEPLHYGDDIDEFFKKNDVELIHLPAERMDFKEKEFDEAWMYNCLQHVKSPDQILDNMMKSAKILRIFEWLDIPAHPGHPHMFTTEYFIHKLKLNYGDFRVVNLTTEKLVGKAIVIVKTM